MFLVVWKYAEMHQHTFLTTQNVKNIFFKNLILVVWKCTQIHKCTSDVKIFFFQDLDSGCLEVCANASKHVFTTPDVKKYLF